MNNKKTVFAVIIIIITVVLALLLPALLNDFVNKRDESKITYNDEESAYEVSKDNMKSTAEKIEILNYILQRKRHAQIVKVSFKPSKKKEEEIKSMITAEYRKWFSMKQVIDMKDLEMSLEDKDGYKNIELYTIFDTNISYYVCDVSVYTNDEGQAYDLRLYIDSDDYKIYLLQVKNVKIADAAYRYWNEMYSKEWFEAKVKLSQWVEEYYGVENAECNIKAPFVINLSENIRWNINGKGDSDSESFLNIGISEFEIFTYFDNEFMVDYSVANG